MTVMKYAAVASVLMLTAPMAWAQNYNSSQGTQGNVNTGTQSAWGQSSPGSGLTFDTQQKIRQSLEQSGFKNIQVLPEAFIIRAQAPDGSRVAMLLSPDQVTEVVASGTSTGTQGSGFQNGTTGMQQQQQAQQELSRYGYTNVQDVKPMQGWSAEATRNGQNVHVMLTNNGLVATFPGTR